MYELKLHYPSKNIKTNQIYAVLNLMKLSNLKSLI